MLFYFFSKYESLGFTKHRDHNQEENQNRCDAHKHSELDWVVDNEAERTFIINQYAQNADLKSLIRNLYPDVEIPDDADPYQCVTFLLRMASVPKPREKLPNVNTLEQAIDLIKRSKNIVVLTGAGVSVSCGIPDFRSRNGLYARLAVDFPELTEPSDMFDIDFFRENPHPFFKFAKELYPGNFTPSRCHRFIAQLEKSNRLLRNYSQNIDTLETVAGIKRVMNCHGSFKTASCTTCKHQVNGDEIKKEVFDQVIPRCKICPPAKVEESANIAESSSSAPNLLNGSLQNENNDLVKLSPSACVMKPDIVFFGEGLPEDFHRSMTEDKNNVDLFICIGSSLKVHPVAAIPDSIGPEVPQILINRELLRNKNFDINLLGDCDVIVNEISRRLELDEFKSLYDENNKLEEISNENGLLPEETFKPDSVPLQAEENVSKNGDSDLVAEKIPCKLKEEKLTENLGATSSTKEEPHQTIEECNTKVENTSAKIYENQPKIEQTDLQPEKSLTASENGVNSLHNSCNSTNPEIIYSQNDDKPSVNCDDNPTTSQLDDDVDDSDDSDCSYSAVKKWRVSLSKRLPSGKFFFDGSHTYVFPGAEVTMDELERMNETSDCSSNASSNEGKTEETELSNGNQACSDHGLGDASNSSLVASKEEHTTN